MEFKKYVEVQTKIKLKTLTRDDGGKFTSKEFEDFCKFMGFNIKILYPTLINIMSNSKAIESNDMETF
jgi:hypothetical protein